MYRQLLYTIGLALVAVIMTTIGASDKLVRRTTAMLNDIEDEALLADIKRANAEIRQKQIIAIIMIIGVFISQGVQVFQKAENLKTIAIQEQQLADSKVLNDSFLGKIDEASGGATLGNTAYIVDDDDTSIYLLDWVETKGQYEFQRKDSIPIVDGETKLTKKELEDLEGLAIYGGKLYLTTSHSNGRNGEGEKPSQRWFLEVGMDGKIIRKTNKLRDSILKTFQKENIKEYIDETQELEGMNIEGLAIDDHGMVYLGFRNPLSENRALVLRASIENIFSNQPEFESFLLDLNTDNHNYAIVSLDYKDGKLYILGNSPHRYETFPLKIWEWEVGDSKSIQHPILFEGENLFTVFNSPGSRAAKPEVLLIPNDKRFHLFFDANGTGGQFGLLRDGIHLSRAK